MKIKKTLSLRSKLLRILQRDPVCRGKKNTFHIITQEGAKEKKGADVIKYEGICQEDNNITDGSQKESVLLFN